MTLTRQAIQPKSPIFTNPTITFAAFFALHRWRTQSIPLCDQHLYILPYIRLKLQNAFRREDMADDFTFSCMGSTITGVEEATLDRYECIVKVGLAGPIFMGVDDLKG